MGPATALHGARQVRTWASGLAAQKALDAPWDWTAEIARAAEDPARLVLAVCERARTGRLHALMSVALLRRSSRLQRARDLLYVDMLAVAPWNRPAHGSRELKGLGPLLLDAAVLLSREAGLDGAFGLHSLPDPATERFYRDTMEMVPLGPEPTPEGELWYFEMPPDPEAPSA